MWKICDFVDFLILLKKYSYLNFHPIFKNIVSKCLAEHLHLRKNIFKNLKNYLRRQNGPKMGKNGLKKWKICNFANFKPFFDGLVLYNAMPKYSIWSCQHFGTKKLKIKWKIKSQWAFENIFYPLEDDCGRLRTLGNFGGRMSQWNFLC